MKVFFDNCTSPTMARTLNAYLQNTGDDRAAHLRDILPSDASDIEWITFLSESPDQWIVITGDARIARNRAERAAFRQARLKGVVLAAAYQKTPMNRCCAVLIDQWPAIREMMLRFEPPVMLEMSINFRGRFKQLSL